MADNLYRPRINWAPHDATIRRMRAEGATVAAIGEAIGCSSSAVNEYCRKHGITVAKKVQRVAAERESGPLPAGHPIALAVLEGRA